MHSGGAQTVLRNNRKLLKKRRSNKQRYNNIVSLSDAHYVKIPDKSLITLSASERKSYSKSIRRKTRIEFILILILIIGAIIFWGIKLSQEQPGPIYVKIITNSQSATGVSVLEYDTNLALTPEELLKQDFNAYMGFGDQFLKQEFYGKALKMYNKALTLFPDNADLKQLIKTTYSKYEALKKVNENN